MTVEADIVTALSALVGGRMFPDVAPFGTARPYITYLKFGGQSVNYQGNEAPDRQHGLYQFNSWHDTRAGANALARQIEDALRAAAAFQAQPASEPVWQHDDELKRYAAIQDFSIWSAR